jgi:cardiolipin synthase
VISFAKYKQSSYTLHNKVEIVRGGARYFRTIEEVASKAVYSLHLQTYIFDEDETGAAVANALKAAAQRGVLVYVLLDGYASQQLSAAFIQDLKTAGVYFRFFEPFFRGNSYYFGRRLHHKVVVADGRYGLVGGVNISNRYNDMEGRPAWLDWAIFVEGEVAQRLDKICVRMWNRGVFASRCLAGAVPAAVPPPEECLVRVSRNDWVFRRTEITNSYRNLFSTAQKEITILTSYFWPPHGILRRMVISARSGKRVRVVLTGHADVPLVKYAERYLYGQLLRNNVEIYEYEKNVLHGKIAIADRQWATVGSYNLNTISAFASVELNLDVQDTAVAGRLCDAVNEIILSDCRRITNESFVASSGPVSRVLYYLSFRVIQLLFALFTFYFSQKKKGS